MLTCLPGDDPAPYHGRQVVVVARADWHRWRDPQVSSRAPGTLAVSPG